MRWIAALAAVCLAASPAWAQGSGGRMNQMDLNGDGQITRAEAEQARAASFERLDTNRDGALSEVERSAAGRRSQGLTRADANNDGVVTRAEFTAQPMRMFERLDADGNDILSATELQAVQGRLNRGG